MLDFKGKAEFSRILEYVSDSLDIPDYRYQEAEERYKAVGRWLSKPDSPLSIFDPEIYPQGSFRLGTVVKPISEEDEYDIDLVCQLNTPKHAITQQALKKMVGDRLKANKAYAGMLDKEGRKCWTLLYADSAKFHMDILPAIPDEYRWLLAIGVPFELARHAISITDKEARSTDPFWPASNPKGYAEWFRSQMRVAFDNRRAFLAERLMASVEDVPEYKVKTTLQRAVQILKRHRDITFQNDPDDKPISIIITTLAAHAYRNEEDLFDALHSIVTGMPEYILRRSGSPWIPNPVNPKENFAERWENQPVKEVKFMKWLDQVIDDLASAIGKRGIHEVGNRLKPVLGERAVNEAILTLGRFYEGQRRTGSLRMASGTGLLGSIGATPVRNHTFYGK